MKKLFMAAMFCLGLSTISFATGTSEYYVNDDAVEAVFTQSTPVLADMNATTESLAAPTATVASEKNPIVAWLLTGLIVGAHRWYLGTSTTTKVVYCLTAGGCGILNCVDSLLLLINGVIGKGKNMDKYLDNPGILMWKK